MPPEADGRDARAARGLEEAGAHVAAHLGHGEVEQSGRFQMSVYEQDYREMTRETWKRARQSFDAAYQEFKTTVLRAWAAREGGQ